MRRLLPLLFLPWTLAAGCRDTSTSDSKIEEWRVVLHAKRAASMTMSDPLRQRYADELLAFIKRHPDHARAREVYDELQLAYARELASNGEYETALRYYDDLLRRSRDSGLAAERAAVIDSRTVDRAELASVESGMTAKDVESRLGSPPSQWKKKVKRDRVTFESWYYRNSEGGLAVVHFEAGKLFAADYLATTKP